MRVCNVDKQEVLLDGSHDQHGCDLLVRSENPRPLDGVFYSSEQ